MKSPSIYHTFAIAILRVKLAEKMTGSRKGAINQPFRLVGLDPFSILSRSFLDPSGWWA
jgi:hypothetical protein